MDDFQPYLVSWNLTRKCNLTCQHCYIDASKAGPDELTTAEARRVVSELADVNPETLLILTGGEPLCRPDLDVLVADASGRGMTVVLGTNGTLLDPHRARALKQAGLAGVGISLDSLVAGDHDRFRGSRGAWRGAVAGMAAAKSAGLDVQLQMTLTRDNVKELPRMVEFCRDMEVPILTVFFLVCTGRGQGLVDLAPEEYETILTDLVDTRPEGVMLRPRCAPTFRRILARKNPDSLLLESDAGRCLAARHYCRITPEGAVTPCPYMPLEAGSLREKGFGELWRESPLFRSLRGGEWQDKCGECEYKETCGGCRARAFAEHGDPLAEDPWCTWEPGIEEAPKAKQPVVEVPWTADAEQRLAKVPFFVRKVVRRAVGAAAVRRGVECVTPEFLQEVKNDLGAMRRK
jgi:radical SAM protein with 4Fe4S-binding SPASM domain